MKWHVHWPAGVLALVGIVFFAADRLTRTPTVVHAVPGQVIEIPAARDGHYYLQGAVNGVPLRFMVDTGATYVSVSGKFAAQAGLPEGVKGYFGTANGTVEGRIVLWIAIASPGFAPASRPSSPPITARTCASVCTQMPTTSLAAGSAAARCCSAVAASCCSSAGCSRSSAPGGAP